MKHRFTLCLLLFALCFTGALAQTYVNLTPRPRTMTVGEGELVLPEVFAVSTAGLSAEMQAEAVRFAADLGKASGLNVTASESADDALITVAADEALPMEGYKVDVTTSGVTVKASTATGLFFAFQTIKKILPPNVMAGVRDAAVTKYALPVVSIDDAPRFAYRGFMLDVARHFFTVDEVKRMLDVMAYYKLNNFHWHLADDQGWRVEIKKYPRLTTVGATASNCYVTDLEYGPYWTNQQYGPFFYTQDEVREVVAYAAERHITVTPEIDMPGHFVATAASYPEFSCNPAAPPTVWVSGGISSNVLNVVNPAAVQFAKDILAELAELFPGPTIHIGGDECPTTQWENNAQCQARYRELGLTSYRQLQSLFVEDIAAFLKTKGKKIAVWNEALTASGADVSKIQDAEATVYCWTQGNAAAAAKRAAQLGLDNIYTPWGPYYINRKQSSDACEATLPGDGSDNVQRTYNEVPMPETGLSAAEAAHYKGVQGTFWTEHVADRTLLEYLALPRLIAIAETGWSPQGLKNFADFQKRITADAKLLDYNGYRYGRHYLLDEAGEGGSTQPDKVMPNTSTSATQHYYRITTRATDARAGRCWELLRADSPLLTQYANNGAEAGRLWTNAAAAEGDAAADYQQWCFEQDPTNPAHYALVCKAQPEGSLNASPTQDALTGRWTYDNAAKHYNFVLGEGGYGQADGAYYYSIQSDALSAKYLNASLGGQGFAVNVYDKANDGGSGVWLVQPLGTSGEGQSLLEQVAEARTVLATAQTYDDAAAPAPGQFLKSAAEALAALLHDADPEKMSADEFAAFKASFEELYPAFRSSFGYLQPGKAYRMACSVAGYEGTRWYDQGKDNFLRNTTAPFADDAWEVTTSSTGENFTQSVKLVNAAARRAVTALASSKEGNIGKPVYLGNEQDAATLQLTYQPATHDFIVSLNGENLFPILSTSTTRPGIVSAGSIHDSRPNAIRPMGAAWQPEEVTVATYTCKSEGDEALGTFKRSVAKGEDATTLAPEIHNYAQVSITADGENAYTVVYRRAAYTLSINLMGPGNTYLSKETIDVPVGESHTVTYPEIEFFTFGEADVATGTTLTPDADQQITAHYTSSTTMGIASLAEQESTLVDGTSYAIYDCSPANNGGRKGFRAAAADKSVSRVLNATGASPYAAWTLHQQSGGFSVENNALHLSIPALSTSAAVVTRLVEKGETFRFNRNAQEGTWSIAGASNGVCWDGSADGRLVGWTAPGHPHEIYRIYAAPYFTVTLLAVDHEGRPIGGEQYFGLAGEKFNFSAPIIDEYNLQELEGIEALDRLTDNVVIKARYLSTGIDQAPAAPAAQSAIYDLMGRRVDRASAQGIYVVNGRKVLVH